MILFKAFTLSIGRLPDETVGPGDCIVEIAGTAIQDMSYKQASKLLARQSETGNQYLLKFKKAKVVSPFLCIMDDASGLR
jgi:C-terminal processing protease CtpA/Prc